MHQSIPVLPSIPPPPSSRQLRDICPPCQSQGWVLANVAHPGGTPQNLLTFFSKLKVPLKCYVFFILICTVEPRLSGPRLSGLFDYLDFFSGTVFFMNVNKL